MLPSGRSRLLRESRTYCNKRYQITIPCPSSNCLHYHHQRAFGIFHGGGNGTSSQRRGPMMDNVMRSLSGLQHRCLKSLARKSTGGEVSDSMTASSRSQPTSQPRIVQLRHATNQQRTFSSSASTPASASASASSSEQSTLLDNRNNTSGGTASNPQSSVAPIDFEKLAKHIPSRDTNGFNTHISTSTSASWYVVVTAALLSFHQEAAVGELWRYIAGNRNSSEDDGSELITLARRIRESCLKASVLVGFPRVSAVLSYHHSRRII